MHLSDGPDRPSAEMPPFAPPPSGLEPGRFDPDRGDLRARSPAAGEEADDVEVIAQLLSGSHRARALSRALIDRFRTAARVLAAPADRLLAVGGLDDAAAAAIKAAETLAIRHARAALPDRLRPGLDSYARVVEYCRALAGHHHVEEFRILFLDSGNRLIRDELHQRGTVNHTPAYPREICVRALETGAAAIVAVHNHPSGDPSPSKSDIDTTRRIRDAVRPIGVTLHDHVIVTPSDSFSFQERGLL